MLGKISGRNYHLRERDNLDETCRESNSGFIRVLNSKCLWYRVVSQSGVENFGQMVFCGTDIEFELFHIAWVCYGHRVSAQDSPGKTHYAPL